ncbi:MAG: ATP-binding cassette domain-containing protein [Bacteroidota bacterium]
MNSLVVDSVELSFGGRSILSNVYLKCEPGDVIGLLGRNGSGKSSLLKIIFGALKGTHQSVRYNGKYTEQLYRLKQAIHFVPQEGLFMNYLTLEDLVKIFRLESCIDYHTILSELRASRTEKIGNLSGGMKKFIEVLTILYTEGSYVLLDEPFSYLSPVLVEKLIPHIKKQSEKKGIILTDHQYEWVWSVANKHYVLYEGSLKAIYESDELERFGYLAK